MTGKTMMIAAALAMGAATAGCETAGFGGSGPSYADLQAENARLTEALAAAEADRDAAASEIAALQEQLDALQEELDLARGVRR